MNGSKASITDLCKILSAGPLDPNVEVMPKSDDLKKKIFMQSFFIDFFSRKNRLLLDAQQFTSHLLVDYFLHQLV